MKALLITLLTVTLLTIPGALAGGLGSYSQDFEGLVQADPGALGADGWLVFGNVYDPGGGLLYWYGPFPAPNNNNAFSAIAAGQGGPDQGAQQLSVYSDYNNFDHGAGNLIEANVFQEQVIDATDVGSSWVFRFDAKLGNIEGASTALAFIKTVDLGAGGSLSRFITVDMTSIPVTWGTYSLSIEIEADIAGHLLQFGFLNLATNYEGSGIFYDNVVFEQGAGACCTDGPITQSDCVQDTRRNCEDDGGVYFGDGIACADLEDTCEALVVEFDSVSVNTVPRGVRIDWTTALEMDTAGFRVLREVAGRQKTSAVVISPMIAPAGYGIGGGSYTFLDADPAARQASRYFIEDVDIFGRWTRHGPFAVQGQRMAKPAVGSRVAPRR